MPQMKVTKFQTFSSKEKQLLQKQMSKWVEKGVISRKGGLNPSLCHPPKHSKHVYVVNECLEPVLSFSTENFPFYKFTNQVPLVNIY